MFSQVMKQYVITWVLFNDQFMTIPSLFNSKLIKSDQVMKQLRYLTVIQ